MVKDYNQTKKKEEVHPSANCCPVPGCPKVTDYTTVRGMRKYLRSKHPTEADFYIQSQYTTSAVYQAGLDKFHNQLAIALQDEHGKVWRENLQEGGRNIGLDSEFSQKVLEQQNEEREEYLRDVVELGGTEGYMKAIMDKYENLDDPDEFEETILEDLGMLTEDRKLDLNDPDVCAELNQLGEEEYQQLVESGVSLKEEFTPAPLLFYEDYTGEREPTEEEFQATQRRLLEERANRPNKKQKKADEKDKE